MPEIRCLHYIHSKFLRKLYSLREVVVSGDQEHYELGEFRKEALRQIKG